MAEKRDLRTEALILKRVNYGETDRILTMITPVGRKSVLARGARREKSKLAGGIELFSLSDVVIHEGNSDLAVLTSAKSKKFYKNILGDLTRLEVAGEIMKQTIKISEHSDEAGNFEMVRQCLESLDAGSDIETVLAWFYFNLAKASGEQINLLFDDQGTPLQENERYRWDAMEKALVSDPSGKISSNEIKMMRLMCAGNLKLVLRVSGIEEMIPELLYVARTLNQI